MQHFCDKRAAKNNKKNYIWQQVNILAIHVTGGVSVWFFKPFLMNPLSLQELGCDNAAYLDPFTVLLYFIFYIFFHIFIEKTILFSRTSLLRTLAITDTKSSPRPPRVSAIKGVHCTSLKLDLSAFTEVVQWIDALTFSPHWFWGTRFESPDANFS